MWFDDACVVRKNFPRPPPRPTVTPTTLDRDDAEHTTLHRDDEQTTAGGANPAMLLGLEVALCKQDVAR